jgi:endoglycosylceramidase
LTADTEVFVPALQYPTGYRVSVSGGTAVSRRGAEILRVRNARSAAEVQVKISPAP